MSLLFCTYIFWVIFAKSNGQTMEDYPRIIGGQPVDVSVYPFMALTIHQYSMPGCGGSILRKEYPAIILTAAHCIDPFDSDDDIVRLYANYVGDKSNSIDSKIMGLKIHPNYSYPPPDNTTGKFDNDIALLWLSKDISAYDKLQTVTINPLSAGSECCNSGDDLEVIGYGKDCSECDPTLTLEYVGVDYVDRSTCYAAYAPEMLYPNITNKMICAARADVGACSGDSGGPLIRKGTNEQVGIVSWGYGGCAHPDYPVVYTDVGAFYDWINSQSVDDAQSVNNNLSDGQILGVIIGCLVLVILSAFLINHYYERRKNKQNVNQMPVYGALKDDKI